MPFQLEAGRTRSGSLTRPSESCVGGEMATSEEQMWLFNMEGMRGMKTDLTPPFHHSSWAPMGSVSLDVRGKRRVQGLQDGEVSHPSRQSKGG